LRRASATPHRDPVTIALQGYADRGVFRGFRATPAARGRIAFEFKWLTKRPVQAMFDTRANTLTFPRLLPQISTAAVNDVIDVLRSRAGRGVPAHKRIDARRAAVAGARRTGAYSISVAIRGTNHLYAVKTALSVINDIFITLQERHPEYLIEHFGMSAE
jgi:hypothetical protein